MRLNAGHHLGDCRGAAMPMAILAAGVIFAIALDLTQHVRTDRDALKLDAMRARAQAITDAAFNRTAVALFDPIMSWHAGKTPHQWTFDGAAVSIGIVNEGARISLKSASRLLLDAALRVAEIDADKAAMIVDAIIARRPRDDDGAAADLLPLVTIGQLRSLEFEGEILVDGNMFDRMAPLFTARSTHPLPDRLLIGERVAMALENAAANGLEVPQDQAFPDDPLLSDLIEYVDRPLFLLIEIDVNLDDAYRMRSSVSAMVEGEGQAIDVLQWRRAIAARNREASE